MHLYPIQLTGALLVALAILGACGGESPPGTGNGNNDVGEPCAAGDDCRDGLECSGPDDPQVCGIAPREGCASADDCFGSDVCNAIYDGCSTDGIGSECGAPCSEGLCGAGFRCGASGACEAVPCDDPAGAVCSAFEVCDSNFAASTPVYDRTSGCRAIICTDDDGCPSATVCVNGRCQSDHGVCVEPILVP